MTDANSPKLDIWGEPTEGKHDCFYCDSLYNLDSSTASNEYRGTYCSAECEKADMKQLKAEAKLDQKLDEGTIKVGDFHIKVRKEQE